MPPRKHIIVQSVVASTTKQTQVLQHVWACGEALTILIWMQEQEQDRNKEVRSFIFMYDHSTQAEERLISCLFCADYLGGCVSIYHFRFSMAWRATSMKFESLNAFQRPSRENVYRPKRSETSFWSSKTGQDRSKIIINKWKRENLEIDKNSCKWGPGKKPQDPKSAKPQPQPQPQVRVLLANAKLHWHSSHVEAPSS